MNDNEELDIMPSEEIIKIYNAFKSIEKHPAIQEDACVLTRIDNINEIRTNVGKSQEKNALSMLKANICYIRNKLMQ